MNYGQIRKLDIANGNGIRTSIFVTGCTHKCFNCFNEEYQNPQAGKLWTDKETEQVLNYVSDPNVSGLTLLGGEPFQNVDGLLPVVKRCAQRCLKRIFGRTPVIPGMSSSLVRLNDSYWNNAISW